MIEVLFDDVSVGGQFEYNGTQWIKKSNRTAVAANYSTKRFYFSANDQVTVNV